MWGITNSLDFHAASFETDASVPLRDIEMNETGFLSIQFNAPFLEETEIWRIVEIFHP
jgi:hypothetical protein